MRQMIIYVIYETTGYEGHEYTHFKGFVTSEDEAKKICSENWRLEYMEIESLSTDHKIGFRIICNKCESEDVTKMSADGGNAYIYCNHCDNEE
jgi:hypothetical protein